MAGCRTVLDLGDDYVEFRLEFSHIVTKFKK